MSALAIACVADLAHSSKCGFIELCMMDVFYLPYVGKRHNLGDTQMVYDNNAVEVLVLTR